MYGLYGCWSELPAEPLVIETDMPMKDFMHKSGIKGIVNVVSAHL